MIPVILESPYAASGARQRADYREYHARCMLDSLSRGESPISSHGTWAFSRILDDDIPKDRELGIKAGYAWIKLASHMVVYTDHGISPGMQAAITEAERIGRKVIYRRLESDYSGYAVVLS